MSGDKYSYGEGDLQIVHTPKTGPKVKDTIVDLNDDADNPDFGKPDPDFRAPDFSEAPKPKSPEG